jgi:prevent-host-death family protein
MTIRYVQSSEAKTHLLRLLDDVERGETIVITRHGRAIARLTPETEARQEETRKAVEEMKALRASLPKVGITINDVLEMRHEGHRY